MIFGYLCSTEKSPDGGIGRRAGLKIQCPLKACRFDPGLGHQKQLRNREAVFVPLRGPIIIGGRIPQTLSEGWHLPAFLRLPLRRGRTILPPLHPRWGTGERIPPHGSAIPLLSASGLRASFCRPYSSSLHPPSHRRRSVQHFARFPALRACPPPLSGGISVPFGPACGPKETPLCNLLPPVPHMAVYAAAFCAELPRKLLNYRLIGGIEVPDFGHFYSM